MIFLNLPKLEKKEGFLDTEESVREARRSLEMKTEEDYKRYENAKRVACVESQENFLD